MAGITPNPNKRGYLLPSGCKDLIDVLIGPPEKPTLRIIRINEKIRAKVVRVVGLQKENLGLMEISKAIKLARSRDGDLVEIAHRANPPICRIVDRNLREKLSQPRKKNKPGASPSL